MLHILLTILKIVGIILLCIVGLLLLLAALVLFVPVRYRIKASKEDTIEENGQNAALTDSLHVCIRVTWLLHLLSATLAYEKELLCRIKVLGIVIYDLAKNSEKAAKKEKKAKKAEKEKKAEKLQKESSADNTSAKETDTSKASGDEDATPETAASEDEDLRPETESPENGENGEEQAQQEAPHTSLLQKIKQFIQKIRMLTDKILQSVRNLEYTFHMFCDKIKAVLDRAAYYKEILEKEETKQAFAVCGRQLKRLLKYLKPSKFQVNVRLGMDDPASLGQILSIYGILYPAVGENVHFTPDFERKALEGSIDVKGKITAFCLLRIAWTLYFNKNIKYLLGLLKKGGEVNG